MPEAAQPPRQLVVEDHADLAEALALNLRHQGHAVDCARDGYEALHLVRTRCYDLLILDLNLPRRDGREVLEDMKRDPALQHIPVVVLTSSEAEEDILRSYRLHANCFVTKPVDLDDLSRVIEGIGQFWFNLVKLPSGGRA